MKILAIGSSPRLNGNSNSLLREALKAAEDAGHHTELMLTRKMKIENCHACESCKEKGECVRDDDMQKVYASLREADAWVLATPVYFYAASGWLKAVIDRTYALFDDDGNPTIPVGKKLYVITTQEESNAADGEAIVANLARATKWIGMDLAGSLVATDVSASEAYKKRPDLIKKARALLV